MVMVKQKSITNSGKNIHLDATVSNNDDFDKWEE